MSTAGTARVLGPQDGELFGACQARWMRLHPPPDHDAALALDDPADRIHAALLGQYVWYRETAPMAEWIHRDRSAVPALDDLMQRTADARLARLADDLASALQRPGQPVFRARAVLRLALDVSTWRRLDSEGLDDPAAATLMTDVALCAG